MIDNRDIFRYTAIGLVIALSFLFLTSWMGRMEYFFAHGAPMDVPLHPEFDLVDHDLPELEWVASNAEVAWNANVRKQVAKDYRHAWKRLNKCLRLENFETLEDFFDESLIARIVSNDSLSFTSKKQVNLNHHLTLQHLSKDYSVVVFTDENLWLRTEHMLENGDLVQEDRQYSMDVKMVLQDGNWKIYNWTPLVNKPMKVFQQKTPTDQLIKNLESVKNIKGINYYPSDTPWFDFWPQYDSDTIASDMGIIRSIGFNTVRVFISFEDLGRDKINVKMIDKFEDLLCRADEQNIIVIPTLFDFPIGFDLEYYPSYFRQVHYLFDRFKDDNRILSYCLKNESDLDFDYHGENKVKSWLSFVINVAKKTDVNHPITVGWANYESANILADQLDYISIHHYKGISDLKDFNEKMKAENRMFVIEEFGFTSAFNPYYLLLNSENTQANNINDVVQFANMENIPWLVWTLYDFKSTSDKVFGWRPWVRKSQRHYGLIDKKGKVKKSAYTIISNIKKN